MNTIVKNLIYLFHLIYNYHTDLYFRKKINLVYSVWLSFDIKHAKKVHFACPINLIGGKHITIGENTSFGKFCILSAWDKYANELFSPELLIGCRCSFGEYNHITSNTRVEIGDDALTGRWVTITDNSHGTTDNEILQIPPIKRRLYSRGGKNRQ